jgi:Tol biopolymer transport system component/DNA-binding winged helix-turn-helix (wHTH) protein
LPGFHVEKVRPLVARRYRFDDVEIDVSNFRVLKAGNAVAIEPKALSVLIFLVENRGGLIEKRTLIDAVWNEAFVTENVLTRVIAQLRRVLGDDAKEARYIETVPTRGYRFVARVETEENGEAISGGSEINGRNSASSPTSSRRSSRRYAISAVVILGAAAVAAIAFSVVRRRSVPDDLHILRETQLTTSDGLTLCPSFSPDATALAYSADRGKGYEILVRQLSPGSQEVQITSDGGQNTEPAWSPDGKLIAYYSHVRGGIWLIPALGGTSRKLSDFGSHPSWSRDGQWIAFQSGESSDFVSYDSGAFPPSTIWVVRPDGTGARQITELGKPEGGHGSPSWSPDGKHIVFVTSQFGDHGLWAVGADGLGLVRMVPDGPPDYDPVYSPDGKSIVYGAIVAAVNYGLWQLRISPDTSAPLGEPTQLTNSGSSVLKNLSFSSDGKKLLYVAAGTNGSLQSLPISATGEPDGEPRSLVSAEGCRIILPAFSPDGSRIAFSSCLGRAGVLTEIWVMNSDGSNAQQLTPDATAGGQSVWYPDGRHILFESGVNGRREVFLMDVDTRQQREITEFDQDAGRIALSPDGTQLAYSPSVGGVVNIWLKDLAAQKTKQITFDKELLGFPMWSPNGKFLSAELKRGKSINIAILPSSGGAATQLTFGSGTRFPGGWSPDGDKIVFAELQAGGYWNLWTVSRSTKTVKQSTHYTKLNAFVRSPVMSPRGDQIVYEYTESTGNIWMLEFK